MNMWWLDVQVTLLRGQDRAPMVDVRLTCLAFRNQVALRKVSTSFLLSMGRIVTDADLLRAIRAEVALLKHQSLRDRQDLPDALNEEVAQQHYNVHGYSNLILSHNVEYNYVPRG